jgi:NADH-quinone oxidoreductase subunit A
VSRLVAPPKPTPLKNERFECGNPPSKEGRGQLTMQYYGYLVVFLTVEPVFIYSFLLLMDAHQAFSTVVALFAMILLMLIPPLIFGLDSARKIRLWKMKEETKQ